MSATKSCRVISDEAVTERRFIMPSPSNPSNSCRVISDEVVTEESHHEAASVAEFETMRR